MTGFERSPEDFYWQNFAQTTRNRVANELRQTMAPELLAMRFRNLFGSYNSIDEHPNQVLAVGSPQAPKYWVIKSGRPVAGWQECYSIGDESDIIASFYFNIQQGDFDSKTWVNSLEGKDAPSKIHKFLDQFDRLGYHVPVVEAEF